MIRNNIGIEVILQTENSLNYIFLLKKCLLIYLIDHFLTNYFFWLDSFCVKERLIFSKIRYLDLFVL